MSAEEGGADEVSRTGEEKSVAGSAAPAPVPRLKIGEGVEIPFIGLGTWNSDPAEVVQAVKDAIDVGYRSIDCALLYGNEKQIGEALQAKIEEGVVKREDLFITSKLWCTFHRADLVVSSLKQSLEDLGVAYVDLYLMHWPMGFHEDGDLIPKDEEGQWMYSEVDYVDTWKAMEECVTLGLAKSIGVSNFNSEQLERILSSSTVKPAVNQIECHPFLSQEKLIEFCKSKGVEVVAYSPLTSPNREDVAPDAPKLLENSAIALIASKYEKTPAQVVLRWQTQRGVVVIPKSVHKDRITENFNIFDFSLDDEDIATINSLNTNTRSVSMEQYKEHKYYPFNIDF